MKSFAPFVVALFAFGASAQDLEIDPVEPAPVAKRSAPRGGGGGGGPWRAGVGFQSGLGPLGGNFTLNPGLALITEYCLGEMCLSAAGSIIASSGQVNFGNVNIQQDGFDADVSLGGRAIFVPGPSEFSGFGVLQLGMSDPGNNLLTELGLFFGLAFEQQVWSNVHLRVSSSIVGAQSAFQNNASVFALLITLNPAAAVVVHF
jgi:hypothetical protein